MGPQLQDVIGVHQGVGRSASADVGARAGVQCRDVIRLDGEHLVRGADCLLVRVRGEQCTGEQQSRVDRQLLGVCGFLQRPDREARPPRLYESHTESEVAFRVVGFGGQQDPQRRDRFVELSAGVQRSDLGEPRLAVVLTRGRE